MEVAGDFIGSPQILTASMKYLLKAETLGSVNERKNNM